MEYLQDLKYVIKAEDIAEFLDRQEPTYQLGDEFRIADFSEDIKLEVGDTIILKDDSLPDKTFKTKVIAIKNQTAKLKLIQITKEVE